MLLLKIGEEQIGTVIWSDSDIDLSIIQINKKELIPVKFGDADKIKIGNIVYAIGNPIGMDFNRTVTSGIISAVDRTIKIREDQDYSYMEELIQTDAGINSGNSGGPPINANGEVIGINSIKIEEAEGIGFAIPINIIKPVIQKIIENGEFKEASLGIYAYDKEVVRYLKDLKISKGIYVASIDKMGASYGKGLLVGDIIEKIDGIELNKMNELRRYIYTKNIGDEIILTVNRKGKVFDLNINLKAK